MKVFFSAFRNPRRPYKRHVITMLVTIDYYWPRGDDPQLTLEAAKWKHHPWVRESLSEGKGTAATVAWNKTTIDS